MHSHLILNTLSTTPPIPTEPPQGKKTPPLPIDHPDIIGLSEEGQKHTLSARNIELLMPIVEPKKTPLEEAASCLPIKYPEIALRVVTVTRTNTPNPPHITQKAVQLYIGNIAYNTSLRWLEDAFRSLLPEDRQSELVTFGNNQIVNSHKSTSPSFAILYVNPDIADILLDAFASRLFLDEPNNQAAVFNTDPSASAVKYVHKITNRLAAYSNKCVYIRIHETPTPPGPLTLHAFHAL